jgi:pyrimidine-specific ribonucleoside hydrolase
LTSGDSADLMAADRGPGKGIEVRTKRRFGRTRIFAGMLVVGICCALASHGAPTERPAIGWSDWEGHVGQTVVVEGPVVCVGYDDEIGYMNLGGCYPDPVRFTVAVPPECRGSFVEALGADPMEAVDGRTIRVTGRIETYRGGEPIIRLCLPENLEFISSADETDEPIPIIVDDDGSPDGVLALLYFLAHPRYRVVAATVSVGIARPREFAPNLTRLLTLLDATDVAVAAGRETPLRGSSSFPDPWRSGATQFWGLDLPSAVFLVDGRSAAHVIVDVVNSSPDPVTIFASGSLTNLAEALRIDPDIAGNIAHVSIMGGALYVPGNIHHDWPGYPYEDSEWNIWVDPLAAKEVLQSGLNVRLAPLDATNAVPWVERDLAPLEQADGALTELALDLLRLMLPLSYVWDLVAASALETASCCTVEPQCVDVVTLSNLQQGRTAGCLGPPNVLACLDPDPGCVKQDIVDVLLGVETR